MQHKCGMGASWTIYQPLIVGLGAVVVATLGNTLLEWYRQHLRHMKEAQILRCAFLQELRTQRAMIANSMSPDQREEKKGGFMIPLDAFMPVYDNMIGKIGVLEPAEVSGILEAYSYLLLVPKNLALLGQLRRDEYSSWMYVDVQYADLLSKMNDKIIGAIDPAINELSKH